MKKMAGLVIIVLLTFNFVYGQAPKSFNYQAVVRNAAGNPMANQDVSFQINLIQDSAKGIILYSEIFNGKKTNPSGVVNLDIGSGTPLAGSFSLLDWSKHNYFLGLNLDPAGGSNYTSIGVYELLSVPYALYAASAGNSSSTNLSLTGTGSTTVTGTYPNYTINGKYQSLNLSYDTIYLSNGGFVKLPYKAGTGIGFTGTIINNTLPNATHTGDAIGSGALTVIALQGNPVSSISPTTNQVLSWNGNVWMPVSNAGQTYYAGAGLSITGNTFINTAPNMTHTGDVTGSGVLTVVAIQGSPVATTIPLNNQGLRWNGTTWSPSTISENTYFAGTGLSLSGNTFINTAPATIGGSGTSNQVTFWTGSNTIGSDANIYWDNINKRLGIGTTATTQQLELTGNINLPNTTSTAGNIYKAGSPFIHNFGTRNTFTGINSGNLAFKGTDNTGVGYGALYSISTGSNNSAMGTQALYNNTIGSYNTATGYYALYTNSTGSFNSASGYQSLYYNSTGNSNTATGPFALHNNSLGGTNTATGYDALYTNSTGSANTATGNSALYANTTGTYNTATGTQALYSNTTGGNNVAMGYLTLDYDSNGSYNTAVGNYTLLANYTGSYNTGIGYYANLSANNLSNATVMGYGAIVNASNKVRLGNTAVTVIEGQVSFSAASDSRFKQNIKNIGVGLDFVMKLRPVEYNTKTGDTRLNYGFIAQELLQIVGENNTLVNIGGDEEKTLSVRHTDLIAPVVKAIQEQQTIILNQQNQINNLIKENEQIKQLLIQKGIMEK